MKELTEADILIVMREEWDKKVSALAEDVGIMMDPHPASESSEPVISSELKVIHKDSGIRYTIDSVGPQNVILRTPEGESFLLDKDELERDYALA